MAQKDSRKKAPPGLRPIGLTVLHSTLVSDIVSSTVVHKGSRREGIQPETKEESTNSLPSATTNTVLDQAQKI